MNHIGWAIQHIMRGQEYLGLSVKSALDSIGMGSSGQQRSVIPSKRELDEVVRLFVSGMTITEIAAKYQNNQHAKKYGDAETRHRARFGIVPDMRRATA